jgi:ribonuclease P protein component
VAGRPSGGRSPKRRRLSRSAEFERVYRQGRSKSNRYLVLYAFPRAADVADDDGEGPRMGLSVSRRVGGAVDRTRVKRVLREAFWAEAERLPEGSDYVVVARPDARELAEREGIAGVRAALSELVGALTGADTASAPESAAVDAGGAPGPTAADVGSAAEPAAADAGGAPGPTPADTVPAPEPAARDADRAATGAVPAPSADDVEDEATP